MHYDPDRSYEVDSVRASEANWEQRQRRLRNAAVGNVLNELSALLGGTEYHDRAMEIIRGAKDIMCSEKIWV